MLHIDSTIFLWLNATANSPHWLLKLALFSTQQLPALLVAGIVGAGLVGGQSVRRDVLRVLLAMGLAWLVARTGQHLLQFPRPATLGLGTQWLAHGGSAGFPSTHASVAFAFGAAVAMSARHWYMGVAGLLMAALIAWSRVCLGLHFPSDLLAGLVLGTACAALAHIVPRRTQQSQAVY